MRRFLAVLISLAMLLSLVANVAEQRPNTSVFASEGVSENPPFETALLYTEEQKTEVVENRTSNSKTYILPDGTMEYVAYACDVHYKDADGKYKEIDSSIIRTGKGDYPYKNAANSWEVYFGEKKEVGVKLCKGDQWISWEIPGSKSPKKVSLGNENDKKGEYFSALKENSNSIVYEFDGYSIVYSVLPGKVKEDIILENAKAPRTFTFKLEKADSLFFADKNGFLFTDINGIDVFCCGSLFMCDASGKRSDCVALEAFEAKDGIYLTLKADESFFTEDTVYPVVIDPTWSSVNGPVPTDTCVDEQYPSTPYPDAVNLWTGGATGINRMRTFISFPLPPGVYANQVTQAVIQLTKKKFEDPTVRAFRITQPWIAASTTWNNQPAFSTVGYSAPAVTLSTNKFGIYVTDMLKSFLQNTYSYHGFAIKELYETSSTHKTQYHSSEAPGGTSYIPKLIVHYVNTYGTRPYQYCAATSQVSSMGYALEYNTNISFSTLGVNTTNMDGLYKNDIPEYIANYVDSWMTNNLPAGSWSRISDYDSDINTSSPGWFRVVFRISLADGNNNLFYDLGETVKMYWKYQTCSWSGMWAGKSDTGESIPDYGVNWVDPESVDWIDGSDVYDSYCVYYQIKDLRTVNWPQN